MWKEAQLLTHEGVVLLTVFDGEQVVSVELMETEQECNLAEACAVALGFGVSVEVI
jgi:hypothetical protein